MRAAAKEQGEARQARQGKASGERRQLTIRPAGAGTLSSRSRSRSLAHHSLASGGLGTQAQALFSPGRPLTVRAQWPPGTHPRVTTRARPGTRSRPHKPSLSPCAPTTYRPRGPLYEPPLEPSQLGLRHPGIASSHLNTKVDRPRISPRTKQASNSGAWNVFLSALERFRRLVALS